MRQLLLMLLLLCGLGPYRDEARGCNIAISKSLRQLRRRLSLADRDKSRGSRLVLLLMLMMRRRRKLGL